MEGARCTVRLCSGFGSRWTYQCIFDTQKHGHQQIRNATATRAANVALPYRLDRTLRFDGRWRRPRL